MKNISSLLFLVFVIQFLQLNFVSGQDLDFTGSYYNPVKREVLLLKYKNGKITKIMLSNSAGKFNNLPVTYSEYDESLMLVRFSCNKVNSQEAYIGTIGINPSGNVLVLAENPVDPGREFYVIKSEEDPFYFAQYGAGMYIRDIYWRNFISSTKEKWFAEDSQEGTGDNQIIMNYDNQKGKTETQVANINPSNHKISYTSNFFGAVEGSINYSNGWEVKLIQKSTNKFIGTFKEDWEPK